MIKLSINFTHTGWDEDLSGIFLVIGSGFFSTVLILCNIGIILEGCDVPDANTVDRFLLLFPFLAHGPLRVHPLRSCRFSTRSWGIFWRLLTVWALHLVITVPLVASWIGAFGILLFLDGFAAGEVKTCLTTSCRIKLKVGSRMRMSNSSPGVGRPNMAGLKPGRKGKPGGAPPCSSSLRWLSSSLNLAGSKLWPSAVASRLSTEGKGLINHIDWMFYLLPRGSAWVSFDDCGTN